MVLVLLTIEHVKRKQEQSIIKEGHHAIDFYLTISFFCYLFVYVRQRLVLPAVFDLLLPQKSFHKSTGGNCPIKGTLFGANGIAK